MKRQTSTPKYTGEERIHSDGSSVLKKLFENSIRVPKIIDSEIIKSTSKDIAKEAISQIFGVELTAGKEHSITSESKPQEKEVSHLTSEHMEYFSNYKQEAEGKKGTELQVTINQNVEMIMRELKELKDSSDELQSEFKDVVVDEVPDKPGIYHLTFYEGFLKLVLKMKDKVEDGVVFAKLFKSRKREKSYSSMAKKKGTSFTMHQDRAVATQTG